MLHGDVEKRHTLRYILMYSFVSYVLRLHCFNLHVRRKSLKEFSTFSFSFSCSSSSSIIFAILWPTFKLAKFRFFLCSNLILFIIGFLAYSSEHVCIHIFQRDTHMEYINLKRNVFDLKDTNLRYNYFWRPAFVFSLPLLIPSSFTITFLHLYDSLEYMAVMKTHHDSRRLL